MPYAITIGPTRTYYQDSVLLTTSVPITVAWIVVVDVGDDFVPWNAERNSHTRSLAWTCQCTLRENPGVPFTFEELME
jgi:hypothetical protein